MKWLKAAIIVFLAGAASGCGYKPLDAPCSMNEGGGPNVTPGREQTAASETSAVQTLYFAEPERQAVPAPFATMRRLDDCGPLRPINSGVLR